MYYGCAQVIDEVFSCFDWSLFFFFSSRRRHTRFDCDWSSDVCSSDLEARRVEDVVISASISLCTSLVGRFKRTFASTNLFIVARMSWCPETSSRVFGRYFSTLPVSVLVCFYGLE